MAKTLDFNKVNRPVLQLIMQDEARTEINVSTPTESLVEELKEMLPELERVLAPGDKDSTLAAYDLAARLINCNRSLVRVTGEELLTKYHMDLESLLIFYGAYTDFITEIQEAKN